jgi:exo-beta-1,3-glucanase (GH17 family)
MKSTILTFFIGLLLLTLWTSCANQNESKMTPSVKTAQDILGKSDYPAISYGGYREKNREVQPTMAQLKEDMLILSAMGIKLLRTYNVHWAQASNLLKAIKELRQEDPSFEMYVMLGAWIDCKNAWTDLPDRIRDEDSPRNAEEIATAVELANEYPEIVKIIAVGNEAMVKWASEYYVEPSIILKWVNHLQELKVNGKLSKDLWITSSDNFASWGGGTEDYHTDDLNALINAVDFLSVHTYPMHDTHYNPVFWGYSESEMELTDVEKIESAMQSSLDYALNQYNSVVKYMRSIGVEKPVHIGETGWATISNGHYGPKGSRATDEYKSARYYHLISDWSKINNVTVFYFEAFDEKWKDAQNPLGSENHFGLFNLQSEAKYAVWDLVDQGIFEGLTRDGKPITKSFGGNKDSLMNTVLLPPINEEILEENRN